MKNTSRISKNLTDRANQTVQRASAGPNGAAISPPSAETGLPDGLKAGVEALSGLNLDAVRVHYNSPQPARLRALAYTQGTQIFVAPGQERHLPHEAWHVVQQAQGRVAATQQRKGGVAFNDNAGLEQEADAMGAKSEQMGRSSGAEPRQQSEKLLASERNTASQMPVQRWRAFRGLKGWKYSGATMATNSQFDPLWHASVFRVNSAGASVDGGLFFNGFHLTMEYGPSSAKINPHVFFTAGGKYDEEATMTHGQTKSYITEVGQKQWEFDLQTAINLSKLVLENLGPVLDEDTRIEMEKAEEAEKTRKKEKEELEEIERAQKRQAELHAAALKEDEESNVAELLKDASYHGPSYKAQFLQYIRGEEGAIKDSGLVKIAKWYVGMRDKVQWVVSEDPQAAYKGWDKTPANVVWNRYANCQTKTWREKNPKTGLLSEFRMLKFKGYASYKLHPKALKPPKV